MTLLAPQPLPGLETLVPLRGSRPLLPSNPTPLGISQQKIPSVPTDTPKVNTVPKGGFTDESINCPEAMWMMGTCKAHQQKRYVLVPCKRRVCNVCGPAGRRRIAENISFHVRMGMLQGERFAWMVLTFGDPVANFSEFKPHAVKRLASFVRWLRNSCGMKNLQYAATYELQKSGRLHINLIAGGWRFVPHSKMLARWGARVSVEYVQDAEAIGVETAAAYSPEGLGGYVSKLEQAVPADWGRRVSFSQGWRRVPKGMREAQRKGEVEWTMPGGDVLRVLDTMIEAGQIIKVQDGEYAHSGQYHRYPECECFQWKIKRRRRRPQEGQGEEYGDSASYERAKESIALGGSYGNM